MRNTNEQSMKEVLEALLRAYRIEDHVNTAMLEAAWKKIMGQLIAKNTRELKLRGQVLRISVESPALRNELMFAKEQIRKNINEEFKQQLVTDVIIT